jgi:pre-mRNA-processing factor 8
MISSYTALSRVILLLRGLHVNNEKAKIILHPDKNTITEPHFVWLSLPDEEWTKVELAMKDLILAVSFFNFVMLRKLSIHLTWTGKRNSVNIASLSSSEIRDILGQELWHHQYSASRRLNWKRVMRPRPCRANVGLLYCSYGTSTNVPYSQTTDIHGDAIQTVTSELQYGFKSLKSRYRRLSSIATNYEQQMFSSNSDWRVRAIFVTHLPLRLQHIYVLNDDAASFTYVLPKNILRAFITASDLRTQVAAFLYGLSPNTTGSSVRNPKISNPRSRGNSDHGMLHAHCHEW